MLELAIAVMALTIVVLNHVRARRKERELKREIKQLRALPIGQIEEVKQTDSGFEATGRMFGHIPHRRSDMEEMPDNLMHFVKLAGEDEVCPVHKRIHGWWVCIPHEHEEEDIEAEEDSA
jgi:hypothetical protein